MSIRFYCPLGHRLKVPDHRVRKKGRCPVCREKVVVPSVSLPRARRKQPLNGEAPPLEADLSLAGKPRAFDQLAAEFLTRETEFGIAQKMAAISEQAARKQAPPLSLDAPSARMDDVPVELEVPPEPAAMPAAMVTDALVASATPLEVPVPLPTTAAPMLNEPMIGAPVADDQALLSFFASAAPSPVVSPTPSPAVAQAPPASPSPASLSTPIPSPPPVPPPIAAMIAPPRAAVVASPVAIARTTWWTWATRDTIGQYLVHRPTAPQLEVAYWLASLLPFAIVLCAAPAVSHLRLNTAPAWAQAMLLLAGAQLAYAVWLALLPDYSTLRVGKFLFAASASLCGLAALVAFSRPSWLDLSAGGSAAVWCGGCLAAMIGLSFACAKIGDRWL